MIFKKQELGISADQIVLNKKQSMDKSGSVSSSLKLTGWMFRGKRRQKMTENRWLGSLSCYDFCVL